MSDLQQGMDCPWFSSYDKGVPHDIVIPEGGLQNILDTAAETYGQREAIVFQNTHISYRELKELAEKLAASLRRRGVRPEIAFPSCSRISLRHSSHSGVS